MAHFSVRAYTLIIKTKRTNKKALYRTGKLHRVQIMRTKQSSNNLFTNKAKQLGMTFIELFAGLGITSALTVMALPGLETLKPGDDTKIQVAGIKAAVEFAKTAAVDHSTEVTLCHSADAKTCGGTWNDGWLVFVDENGDRQVNSNDVILRSGEKIEGSNIYLHSAIKHSIQFTAQGFAKNAGTYQVCNKENQLASADGISINRSGMLVTAIDSNKDNIRENHDQTPFTCAG